MPSSTKILSSQELYLPREVERLSNLIISLKAEIYDLRETAEKLEKEIYERSVELDYVSCHLATGDKHLKELRNSKKGA